MRCAGFANLGNIGIELGGIGSLRSGKEGRPGATRYSRDAGRYDGEPDVGVDCGNAAAVASASSECRMTDSYTRAESAASFLLSQTKLRPQIGLGARIRARRLADGLTDAVRIPYAQIPSFPRSTAVGHASQL